MLTRCMSVDRPLNLRKRERERERELPGSGASGSLVPTGAPPAARSGKRERGHRESVSERAPFGHFEIRFDRSFLS